MNEYKLSIFNIGMGTFFPYIYSLIVHISISLFFG